MGDKKVEAKAIAPTQDSVASYTVVVCSGPSLAEQYRPMIYSKWLRSLRYGNEFFKRIDQTSYFKSYHKYISQLLADPKTTICLAALSDDRDVVLGFSVSRGTILDYVHVHKDNRNLGIANSLIPKSIDTYSHITKDAEKYLRNKLAKWNFNPFA